MKRPRVLPYPPKRMLKNFRERFADLFSKDSESSPLNEDSSLHEIAAQHPDLYDFIERKYGIKPDPEDKVLPLKDFAEKFGLPPAAVLFMEVQMSDRAKLVHPISATDARALMLRDQTVRVLDVREDWEGKICGLPRSSPLNPELLDEILHQWDRNMPILLYCHYGIRSLDAATFLADRGFSQVFILEGGIEAWSRDVDPSVPRYDGAYC